MEKIISDFQRLKDELMEKETLVNLLNYQISKKEEIIINLTSQNNIQIHSINDLKEENITLKSDNSKLDDSLRKAEASITELDSSLKEMEIERATLKARMDLMQDDFSIIQGIGPKISYILHSARIDTFEKLADTSIKNIREILEKENQNLLRLVDPSNWPDQAKRAVKGNQEEL